MPTQPRQDGQPKPPAAREGRQGPRQGAAPAPAQHEVRRRHAHPGRHRPDQQHLPPALRAALLADPQRARRRRRRAAATTSTRRSSAPTPRFYELDKVLAILAKQNKTLADLARDSDTSLAPLARDRAPDRRLHRPVGQVAAATAEKRVALERQLRAPADLPARAAPDARGHSSNLAGAMTPVLNDLRAAAPDLNKFIEQLGPFATVVDPGVPEPRRRGRRRLGGAARDRPAHHPAAQVRQAGEERRRRSGRHAGQPPEDRRHRARHGLPLLHRDRGQRLRHDRPLPAGRADREHVLDLRDRARRRLLGELRQPQRAQRLGRSATTRAATRASSPATACCAARTPPTCSPRWACRR